MVSPRHARAFFAVILFLQPFLAVGARAQGGRGTITGSVVDTGGGVLQGAKITLDPGGINLSSDERGDFTITGLNPGTYTLTISYVGLETFTGSLEVKAGVVVRADEVLKVGAQAESVIVTAERAAGEAEEVNRERTADNLVQVLTSDVIRSLPNANMADALGRLPSVTIERDEGEGKYVQVRGTEPRLTNATIDGVNIPSPESGVRQIKFDAIPADIVESVEINKTLQANMDGDGIGGSVNLVTKTAERPTISLSGMGGYTPIVNGRGLVETTGTVGNRFGKDKKIGALIGFSYDWNGRGIDDIEPVPDIANFGTPAQTRWFDQTDIREYRYYRSRWAIAGSSNYKLGEGSNLYIRGLYSDFHNYGDRWVYTLFDNSGANTLSPTPGTPVFNTQQRRPDYAIGSVVIGGKHVLSTTWFSWDLSVSRSSQTGQVGDRNATFNSTNLASSNCQYDAPNTTDIYIPRWTPACFTEAYNQSNYTLSGVNTAKGLSAQLNLQAAGAMGKRYHIGSHTSTIEIGGKFRNEHKFDNTFVVNYSPNGSVPFSMFPNQLTNHNYYGGSYQLGPNIGFPDVFAYVNSNLDQFTVTDGCFGANYSLIEKVSAGYVMNTLDFSNRWRLVAGVRIEGTNLDTRAPVLDQNGAPTGAVSSANGSYVKVLPSASLRYAITSDTNLRLAYSRGLSRPDPVDIAQPLVVDATTTPIAVTLGNPKLKAETADNVDILVEHYINPFGVIEAGYFYKNLTDPIVPQLLRDTTDSFGGHQCSPAVFCEVNQSINAGSAWINGFEAAYLQHLTFLPSPLKGLGISANYGYTASRASGLPGRSDHPRLIRNSPHTWNVSPTYDRGRVSIRVGLSYNAANINAYQYQDGTPTADGNPSTPTPGGLHGPFSDDYFFAHLQVDAQGSVRLAHGLDFVAYGLNLTNEVFGFYFGSPQYFHQREYYRTTYAFGVRWNPTFEKKQ